jgi:hypothetical protein
MVRVLRFTVGALVCIAVSAAAQTPTSFGDLSFLTPAGWLATQDSGAIKLTPGDLKSGEMCVVILKPTQEFSGDLPSWVDSQWQSVLRMGTKVIQSTPPTRQGRGDSDSEQISASAALQDTQQRPFFVALFGIRLGQRVFPLLWVGNSWELVARYRPVLNQLGRSVKVVLADGNPPLTQDIADNFNNFFIWVFDIKLTPQQKRMMEHDLIAGWPKDPPDETKSKLELADLYAKLKLASDDQQALARQQLLPKILQVLRSHRDDPIAKMVLNAYESQHLSLPKTQSAAKTGLFRGASKDRESC